MVTFRETRAVGKPLRSKPPRTISASEFKAKCLKIMDEVAESGEAVVVTKNGKPAATLSPPSPPKTRKSLYGMHEGSLVDISGVDLAEPVSDLVEIDGDARNIIGEKAPPY